MSIVILLVDLLLDWLNHLLPIPIPISIPIRLVETGRVCRRRGHDRNSEHHHASVRHGPDQVAGTLVGHPGCADNQRAQGEGRRRRFFSSLLLSSSTRLALR